MMSSFVRTQSLGNYSKHSAGGPASRRRPRPLKETLIREKRDAGTCWRPRCPLATSPISLTQPKWDCAYVAQAAEYQNTARAAAILLVLDKTLGGEGAPKLFESAWVEEVKRRDERHTCRVVIVRVPGGRDKPDQLRPPAQLYAAG
ncbi:hypothetical protein [Sphaerisporangium dianthi]|uniref:Uncharacterized protein n=1 Tax=Sphaerisporangium dianthi TaxID=1436120 RepID=A0ABV9CJ89_9ACTN